ncbi:MAG: hydrogen peroxide-inducible genes activator, partial [Betaproteobacteria bacterium]
TPRYHSQLVVPVPFTQPAPTRRIALAYRKSFPRPDAIVALRDSVVRCRTTPPTRVALRARP